MDHEPHLLYKTHGTKKGLRCVYRNRLAIDKTSLFHGHVLRFSIGLFCASQSDLVNFIERSSDWMVEYLEEVFDHTLILSSEDPMVNLCVGLENEGVVDIRVMKEVGLSDFAEMIKSDFAGVLERQTDGRVWLEFVSVREHGSFEEGIA